MKLYTCFDKLVGQRIVKIGGGWEKDDERVIKGLFEGDLVK